MPCAPPALFLGKRRARLSRRFQRRFDILSHTDVGKPFGNHAGGCRHSCPNTRAVTELLLIGDHCAVQNHLLQGFLPPRRGRAVPRIGNRCVEQLKRFLYKFSDGRNKCPDLRGHHRVCQHRTHDALGAVQAVIRLTDDAITRLNPKPEIWHRSYGQFFEDVHTRRTKVLINFQRRGGVILNGPKRLIKVAQDTALGVGFLNVLELALSDADCSSFSGSLSGYSGCPVERGNNVPLLSWDRCPLISPEPKYARPSAVCGTISCHCSTAADSHAALSTHSPSVSAPPPWCGAVRPP